MSGRELTALGTGSLVPTPERNHSGHFLRWGATDLNHYIEFCEHTGETVKYAIENVEK